MFFYEGLGDIGFGWMGGARVSVPRRGFIVFLQMLRKAVEYLAGVSVPRRGFIVFLLGREHSDAAVFVTVFQSPEGDSLFFYHGNGGNRHANPRKVSVPRRGFIVFLPGKEVRI